MPHKNRLRYITPLEVQDILDNCYGSDCHLAMMQCIAKGINDLLQGRSKDVKKENLHHVEKILQTFAWGEPECKT